MEKVVFGLEPLSCPTCIKKIEGTLGKMDGVKEVKVLFNANKVRVQFEEDMIDPSQIQNTIGKLGYPVISQKVS